ncbi:hypothetical protein C5167_000130 [Papaver somniferum]|uniref:Uncharacterized protein n=1 Tax=Papaver somniferum TaxID=3469 RepID=A0A4Y7KU05_PAPSO|nr:hypothetical protein C5167_000130 [Papaver somniferum]
MRQLKFIPIVRLVLLEFCGNMFDEMSQRNVYYFENIHLMSRRFFSLNETDCRHS